MRVSADFERFVGYLNSNEVELSGGLENWIERAAEKLAPAAREKAKEFVVEVLGRHHSEAEMIAILEEANFNYYIRDGGARAFLESIQRRL